MYKKDTIQSQKLAKFVFVVYDNELEELRDRIQVLARRTCRRFGCLADCNNRHNSFCLWNIKEFAEFIRFTESHDQSRKSQICRFEDQVFILQTKIIASPSVSKFIVGGTIFLETGAVMYEGCYDQRSILGFTRISRTRKAGCTDLVDYFSGKNTLVTLLSAAYLRTVLLVSINF